MARLKWGNKWDVVEKSYQKSRTICEKCRGELLFVKVQQFSTFYGTTSSSGHGITRHALRCLNCNVSYKLSPELQATASQLNYYSVRKTKEVKPIGFTDNSGRKFDSKVNFPSVAFGFPMAIGLIGFIASLFSKTAFNIAFWFFLIIMMFMVSEMPNSFVVREIAIIISSVLNYYVISFLQEITDQSRFFTIIALTLYFNIVTVVAYKTQPQGNMKEVYKTDRSRSRVFLNDGMLASKNGKYEKAEQQLKEAIKFQHQNLDAWMHLGNIYFKTENFEEAEKAFQEMISIKKRYPQGWYLLGCVALITERYEKAEEHYLTALELDPEFSEAWLDLGKLYFQLEKYEKAVAATIRADKLNPDDPDTKDLLIAIYAAQDSIVR